MTVYEEGLRQMWHSFNKHQWTRRLVPETLCLALALCSRRKRRICVANVQCEASVMCLGQVSRSSLVWGEQWKGVARLVPTYSENKAKLLYQHKPSKGCRSKLSPALKEEWQKILVKAVIWGCYILWISAPKEEETEQEEYEVNANGPHPFKSEDVPSLIKSPFKSYARNLPKGREQAAQREA